MKRERQRGRLIQTWRGLGHIPGARELSVRNSVPVEAVSLDGWLKMQNGRSIRYEHWSTSVCPAQ